MIRRKSIIEFIDITNDVPEQFYPRPAKLVLPDWYKATNSYRNNKKEAYMDERGFSSSTVKKCMPFYDALTSGYILFSHVDIEVSGSSYNKNFKWPSKNAISWHGRWQLGEYPGISNNLENIPKWVNPWAIRTSAGYSCLFINPMNRGDSNFECFEGVVDTDNYSSQVNFPFFLKDNSWEGLIPAGTPIVQVIPFRRDSFDHKIYQEKNFKDSSKIKNSQSLLDSIIFNGYKKYFWSRKEYN